jgi:cation transport regulator ChaB
MPYASTKELPKAVKVLPQPAKKVFMAAFNAIMERKPSTPEASAFKQAWGAVTNAGWEKNEQGEWVKATGDRGPPRRMTHSKVRRMLEHVAKKIDELDDEDDDEADDDVPVVDDVAAPQPWAAWDAHEVEVYETLALDDEDAPPQYKSRKTGQGYLVAYPKVARTGIQIYGGKECGHPEMDEVRVYRPETEVFAKDAMKSFAHVPVTNDHPPNLIDADNWRKYAVGQAGDEVLRDGTFLRVPLVLMDAGAIKAVEDGKRELSAGYTMELRWGSGVTDSGEAYDAVQTGIRGNHIAVVTRARGGAQLSIDKDNAGADMTLKTVTIDGLKCEMTEMSADIVAKHQASSQAALDAATKKAADESAAKDAALAKVAELEKAVAAKDAEAAALKVQLKDAEVTPEKLDQMVKDRDAIVGKAKAIVGDKLAVDGKSTADIRRQVVDLKLGDTAKGWNDDKVQAAFDTLAGTTKTDSGSRNALDQHIRENGFGANASVTDEANAAWAKSVQQPHEPVEEPQGHRGRIRRTQHLSRRD